MSAFLRALVAFSLRLARRENDIFADACDVSLGSGEFLFDADDSVCILVYRVDIRVDGGVS